MEMKEILGRILNQEKLQREEKIYMKELLELARVYRMPTGNIIRYIYIPMAFEKIRNMFRS